MMELVIPTIRQGGVNTVYVMVRYLFTPFPYWKRSLAMQYAKLLYKAQSHPSNNHRRASSLLQRPPPSPRTPRHLPNVPLPTPLNYARNHNRSEEEWHNWRKILPSRRNHKFRLGRHRLRCILPRIRGNGASAANSQLTR